MPAPSRFQYASISDKRLQTREPVSSESLAITANYNRKKKKKKKFPPTSRPPTSPPLTKNQKSRRIPAIKQFHLSLLRVWSFFKHLPPPPRQRKSWEQPDPRVGRIMGAAALRQSRWKDVSDRRDIGPLSERHLALASCVDNGKPECVLHPRLWEYFRQCSNKKTFVEQQLSLSLFEQFLVLLRSGDKEISRSWSTFQPVRNWSKGRSRRDRLWNR